MHQQFNKSDNADDKSTTQTINSPPPDKLNPLGINRKGEPNWRAVSFVLSGLLVLVIIITITSELLRPKIATPSPFEPNSLSPTPKSIETNIPEDSLNWKSISNNIVGIALKYPESYFLYKNNQEEVAVLTSDPALSQVLTGVFIKVFKNENQLPLAIWWEQEKLNKLNLSPNDIYLKEKKSSLTPIRLGSLTGIGFPPEKTSQDIQTQEMYLEKENRIYQIRLEIENNNQQQKAEQILSTLIFL